MKVSLKLTPEEILQAVNEKYRLNMPMKGINVSVEKDQFNNITSMTCVYDLLDCPAPYAPIPRFDAKQKTS